MVGHKTVPTPQVELIDSKRKGRGEHEEQNKTVMPRLVRNRAIYAGDYIMSEDYLQDVRFRWVSLGVFCGTAFNCGTTMNPNTILSYDEHDAYGSLSTNQSPRAKR